MRTEGETVPERLRLREGQPQEVAGPGEFEVRGVTIHGLASGETTIMRIEVDDVCVAAMGKLDRQLTEDEVDALGAITLGYYLLGLQASARPGPDAERRPPIVNSVSRPISNW